MTGLNRKSQGPQYCLPPEQRHRTPVVPMAARRFWEETPEQMNRNARLIARREKEQAHQAEAKPDFRQQYLTMLAGKDAALLPQGHGGL